MLAPLDGGRMMQKLIENSSVALAGLVTSVLTAAIVTIIDIWTGFNVFTFSALVVLPAGAGICGFAAASGYYLAAKFLHKRPTRILLLQMVVIAAFTQFLIYWLEYKLLVYDGTHVADVVPFFQYLDISLTTAHMKIGRSLQSDAGAVGSFGYWLAFFDFLGFILGAAVVYINLQSLPTCKPCNKYLRSTVKKKYGFSNSDEFGQFYDNVYVNPVDSPEFSNHVGLEYSSGKTEKGNINLTTTVFECPHCFDQSIQETVQVYNGRDWKDITDLEPDSEVC
jgi:hypothetical protein